MIELKDDRLHFSFPEVHPKANLEIDFQRTLRIPDDARTYPLPPGLGKFPLAHIDDHAARVPATWRERGGVMLPMYQSEAMWLSFSSRSDYPFAVKIGTGKVSAVTGLPWQDGLARTPQDYLAIPQQPWLDGYCVGRDTIRQFVAMPLGSGYTAEEQLTGKAEHGGLQIEVFPLKAECYTGPKRSVFEGVACSCEPKPSLGLAPGGRMRQQIDEDRHKSHQYSTDHHSRCFVHICDTMMWREMTGEEPPTTPTTAKEYERRGFPWFNYYSEDPSIDPSERLTEMKSVAEMAKAVGNAPPPGNESLVPGNVKQIFPKDYHFGLGGVPHSWIEDDLL